MMIMIIICKLIDAQLLNAAVNYRHKHLNVSKSTGLLCPGRVVWDNHSSISPRSHSNTRARTRTASLTDPWIWDRPPGSLLR